MQCRSFRPATMALASRTSRGPRRPDEAERCKTSTVCCRFRTMSYLSNVTTICQAGCVRARLAPLYAVLLAAIAVAMMAPASAGAATINFDDLPADTVLTNQYQAQGVVFEPQGALGARIREVGTLAHTGTKV